MPALAAPGFAGWTLALVLACVTYAAFAGAATAIPEESRVQVGLAAAVLLAALGLASGALGVARSPLAWAGAGLLALFALYSTLSLTWSIAPDLSWLAANRAAEYAVLVTVVLIAAPSLPRAPKLAVAGLTGLAVVVALYALGGKLLPTLSVGPVDLDHASLFARLRAPLGYWNALGLLMVMASPACIWVAADRAREPWLRITALLVLELLLVTAALAISRGAVVALAVVIAVMVGAGPDRLRRLAVVGVALAAAAPAVAFEFSRDRLTQDGISAADRAGDGVLLAFILAVSMLALAGFALWALSAENEANWGPEQTGLAWRMIAAVAVAATLLGVLGLASSERGLTGSVSHQWDQFRTSAPLPNQPERLVSTSSSNRWTWWSEAAGAFSDRPVAGWGAGSFPLLHNRYRSHPAQVRSAHSVPLQFLAEGGLIGAGLALAGLSLLGAAGVRTMRRSSGTERGARLALLAAGAAWAVHSLYDWDWEIPGVTLAALAAIAIAAAPPEGARVWPGTPRRWRSRAKTGPALGVPLAILGALLAMALATSAALPAVSQEKHLDAQVKAGEAGADTAQVEDALSMALLAHKLNPLDTEALFVAADLEARLGNRARSEELDLEAARLEPDDVRVWERLLQSGRANVLKIAVQKRIETDPLTFALNPFEVAGLRYSAEVPPQLSPTAFGTPPE